MTRRFVFRSSQMSTVTTSRTCQSRRITATWKSPLSVPKINLIDIPLIEPRPGAPYRRFTSQKVLGNLKGTWRHLLWKLPDSWAMHPCSKTKWWWGGQVRRSPVQLSSSSRNQLGWLSPSIVQQDFGKWSGFDHPRGTPPWDVCWMYAFRFTLYVPWTRSLCPYMDDRRE